MNEEAPIERVSSSTNIINIVPEGKEIVEINFW